MLLECERISKKCEEISGIFHRNNCNFENNSMRTLENFKVIKYLD